MAELGNFVNLDSDREIDSLKGKVLLITEGEPSRREYSRAWLRFS